jgi:hypothetical protein
VHVAENQNNTDDFAVGIAEAARIAGRSISWIRRRRRYGPLDGVDIKGVQFVTLASLYQLIRQNRKRPKLRLVVDNTK